MADLMDLLSDAYPWVKSLHVISVIAWMSGMLYLPRIYVYHAAAEVGSAQSDTFKVMERRLLRAIINPAMIAAWLFGLMLLVTPGVVHWGGGWIYVKLVAVVAMSAFHGLLARWRKDFERDANQRAAGFYRAVNEVPTVLMVVIVVMVVAQPF